MIVESSLTFGEFVWTYIADSWLQSTLVASALMVWVVLSRKWSSPFRYAILLIALLKFVTPFDWKLPVSSAPVMHSSGLVEESKKRVHHELIGSYPISPLIELSPETNEPSPSRSFATGERSWRGWLGLIALFGSLLILLRSLVRRRSVSRTFRLASKETSMALLGETSHRVGLRKTPRLRLGDTSDYGPMASGLLRGEIWLPKSLLDKSTSKEIDVIIAHECIHLSRRDPFVETLQFIIRALWWFHPFVWLLDRRIRSVREDCCDERLLADGWASRTEYCQVLLSAARNLPNIQRLVLAPGLPTSPHALERRFKRLFDPFFEPRKTMTLKNRLAVLALAIIAIPGLSRVQAKADDALNSSGIELGQQDEARPKVSSKKNPRDETDQKILEALNALVLRMDKIEAQQHLSALGALMDQKVIEPKKETSALPPKKGRVSYVVLGEAEKTGVCESSSDVTLLEVILRAKPKNTSDLSRVVLIRQDELQPIQLEIDCEAMLKAGNSSGNVLIRGGDTIYFATKKASSKPSETAGFWRGMLKSTDPGKRWEALDRLDQLSPDSLQSLAISMLHDTDTFVRIRSMQILMAHGSIEAIDALKPLLKDDDEVIRANAQNSIDKIKKSLAEKDQETASVKSIANFIFGTFD